MPSLIFMAYDPPSPRKKKSWREKEKKNKAWVGGGGLEKDAVLSGLLA